MAPLSLPPFRTGLEPLPRRSPPWPAALRFSRAPTAAICGVLSERNPTSNCGFDAAFDLTDYDPVRQLLRRDMGPTYLLPSVNYSEVVFDLV